VRHESDEEEGEEEQEPIPVNQLEDVRMSNFAFAQTKIGEFITVIFSTIGICSSIIGSEMSHVNKDGSKDQEIQNVRWSCMLASLLMCISIMGNYQLFIRWQRTKNFIIETDNLFNTGLYKIMIVEVCAVLIQPYPFLQGVMYKEEHMYGNNSNKFQVNDLLLCWMIFSRVYFYARSILSISFYTDPRSQRVCSIYGAEAGYTFALKALMKEKPWNVLACSLAMSVFVFGYCLRLFERVIQPEFTYVSTSMWNVLITMTTVGYGDYFA